MKKSANKIMHQSGEKIIIICQKGVPQKWRDPTKFYNSRLCFIESVHENYQWKAHQPPKAPSMGVILVKILVILMKKSNNNVYLKKLKKNVLGPFDQSAYIHMRNLMKYFVAEVR